MDYYDRAAEDCAHKGESVDKLQFVEKWIEDNQDNMMDDYISDSAAEHYGTHRDCHCDLGDAAVEFLQAMLELSYDTWLGYQAEKAWEDEQC
jgi:hypothetical protein